MFLYNEISSLLLNLLMKILGGFSVKIFQIKISIQRNDKNFYFLLLLLLQRSTLGPELSSTRVKFNGAGVEIWRQVPGANTINQHKAMTADLIDKLIIISYDIFCRSISIKNMLGEFMKQSTVEQAYHLKLQLLICDGFHILTSRLQS